MGFVVVELSGTAGRLISRDESNMNRHVADSSMNALDQIDVARIVINHSFLVDRDELAGE